MNFKLCTPASLLLGFFCGLFVAFPAQAQMSSVRLADSLLPGATEGADSVNLEQGDALKILSWNIYMLPRFIRINGKRKRAEAIVEQVKYSDYDILVFQEAFLDDARAIIYEGLKEFYPYKFGPANPRKGIKVNSGIWILSKMPMEEIGSIEFSQCSGIDDCMARKGALLLQGLFKGVAFQVLGTHLDAGDEADSTRLTQYEEIRKLLLEPKRKEGVPQIVCGDMNTRRNKKDSYSMMMNSLQVADGEFSGKYKCTADGANNDLCWGDENTQQVLDYIFYRGNGREHKNIIRKIPLLRKRWNKSHQDLSDHFPVEARIWF